MMRRPVVALGAAALIAGCSGHPDRVHAFGRDYDRGNYAAMCLHDAQQKFGSSAVVVSHGKPVTGDPGSLVPTVILVQDGDRYYEYELSGAP